MDVGNLFGFKIKSAKNSVEHVDLVLSLESIGCTITCVDWLVDWNYVEYGDVPVERNRRRTM
jgi:hypothetical protein